MSKTAGTNTASEGLEDPVELDAAYLTELENRWFALLDCAVEAESDHDPARAETRSMLTHWILSAPDSEAAELALTGGILSFVEELCEAPPSGGEPDQDAVEVARDDNVDFVTGVVLDEAGWLSGQRGTPIMAQLVLELCELLQQRIPRDVIAAIDRLRMHLNDDPRLRDQMFDDGNTDLLDWLAGHAWVELEDAAQARQCFVRAHRVATPDHRPVLKFMIANCTADLGQVYEAADWAVSAVESAEALGGDVDPDFIESAAELVAAALSALHTDERPGGALDRCQEAYLSRPEWFIPRLGKALYLAAAAELQSDRGDTAAAWQLVQEAEGACQEEPDDVRAEVALTKATISFATGRVDQVLEVVRQSAASVSRGSRAQQARLSALAAALMSTLGQTDPARQELARLPFARMNQVCDLDGEDADTRESFAMSMAADLLDLVHETVTSAQLQHLPKALVHRWLELADRLTKAGPELGAALLPFAAMVTRAAGQPDLAQVLVARAKSLGASSDLAGGFGRGFSEFATVAEQIAVGDLDAILSSQSGAIESSKSSNEFLAAVLTLMHTLTLRLAAAPSRQLFAAACAALQAHARWRAALPSSVERLAFDARLATILPIAYESLAELGDPRLITEFIEFVRSQAMPEATATATATSVSMQRLITELGAADVCDSPAPLLPLDDEIVLGRPAQVRMPWGTIALAEFLDSAADAIIDLDVSC